MSKKINLSFKDKDYLKIQKIAKKNGKKEIEIIRDLINRGKRINKFELKSLNLEKQIDELSDRINRQNLQLFSLITDVIKQNVLTNEVLTAVVQGNKNEAELVEFNTKVEQKSKDIVNKFRQLYLEN